MKVRRAAFAAVLGAGVVVAACGGSGGAGSSATVGPSETAGPSAASPSASPDGGGGGGNGGVIGGPVAAGGDYCGLLGPGDFATAGITGAGAPRSNPDSQGAYCVYHGVSGATGGIEFDVFVGIDEADAAAIYPSVRSFVDLGTGKAALPEADDVAVLPSSGGNPDYAVIAVRKGRLVFGISFPAGTGAQEALIALSRLVLQRGEALSR